jgi:hypothetical protein
MLYVFLAALAVIVVAVVYFSFRHSSKEVEVAPQEFNDMYTDSLAKELEAQKKFEAEYYSNINDVVEFENVEVPVYPIVDKKVAKKKAAKKKSTKKTSKKRTANKVVKDEEV